MDERGGLREISVLDRIPEVEGLSSLVWLLPLVVITGSEVALFFDRVDVALWGHVVALLGCVLGPLVLNDEPLLQAFALVSLFRLLNLGVPTFGLRSLYALGLVYALVFPAVALLVARTDAHTLRETPRTAVLGTLPAVALGWGLAEVEYAVLRPEAMIAALTLTGVVTTVVVMVLAVGLVEELIYRGVIQPQMCDELGRVAGVVSTAFLYGITYAVYADQWMIGFGIVLGLVLGAVYDATESLALSTVVHGSLNVFLFAVIPLRGSLVLG